MTTFFQLMQNIVNKIGSCVHVYYQNLTEDQKAQARENIGASADNEVVKTINGTAPDENGNVAIYVPDSTEGAVLYTAQELTEDQKAQARENIGVVNGSGSGSDTSAYAYFDDLQTYAEKIQNAQYPGTLTLAVMADPHYCNDETGSQNVLDTANKMALLSRYVRLDGIANLGDYIRGDEVKSLTRNDLARLIVNTQQNADCPVFHVRGNHDDNGWYSYGDNPGTHLPEEMIDDTEWYQMVFKHTEKDIVTDSAKPNGGYGYFDHNESKIRVFLLNSVDIPYVLNSDGTYRYNSFQCSAFSNEQLNFVANALKFEDKETPDEWAAMFLTHVPLDTTNDDGYRFGIKDALIRGHVQMLGIINAYSKGTAYTFSGSVNNVSISTELATDFAVSVNVDYSEKGVGDVICFVNGHTHTDNFSQKVGHETSLSYGFTHIGVFGSNSFATLVADRNKNIVTVFKYGEVTPQSVSESHNPGAINGETELGIDMSCGAWEVPFNQVRVENENLYPGLSDLWGDGYQIDTTKTLNVETLELTDARVATNYATSKAVMLKTSTQYEVPVDVNMAIVYWFNVVGNFNGTTTITNGKFTSKSSENYAVFSFNKIQFPDYPNFYLREYSGS